MNKHQVKFRNRLSSYLKNKSIRNLGNPLRIEHLLYFFLYFQKTNYEFGGFKGYKFGLVQFLKNLILRQYKKFGKTSLEYETILLEKSKSINLETDANCKPIKPSRIRVMTLFPSSVARNDQEVKLPILLNIMSSAESAGVYLYDYVSDIVSDFSRFNDHNEMTKEWKKISEIIEKEKINTVIIFGHKNSFSEINGQNILKIKKFKKSRYCCC